MLDAVRGTGGVNAVKELLKPIFALIPLHAACRKGYLDIVKDLVESLDDIDQHDSNDLLRCT